MRSTRGKRWVRMALDECAVERRTVLKGAAAAGVGTTMMVGRVGAQNGCCICWVDVKPDSCPNSINPNNQGVVSVAAGSTDFDEETVKLVPIPEGCVDQYTPKFEDCQDYQNPTYHDDGDECGDLNGLLACEANGDDRSASPTRSTTEDINGDSTQDTVFKFRTQDLDLQDDDAYLVLTGESEDCQVIGIDSVRVVDRGGSRSNSRGRNQGQS